MLMRNAIWKVRQQCYRPGPGVVGSRAFPGDERPQPLPDTNPSSRVNPGRMRGKARNMREIVNSHPAPTQFRSDARLPLRPALEAQDRRDRC